MVLKFLIYFGFLFSAPDIEASNGGWETVDRAQKEVVSDGSDERDPSIWVVFSKKYETEKFLVAFPGEPKYGYIDTGEKLLEVISSSEGCDYRMQIMENGGRSSEYFAKKRVQSLVGAVIVDEKKDEGNKSAEITYTIEGDWYREKFVSSEHLIYFFQTKSHDLNDEKYIKFINSFDFQKRKI